MVALVLLAMGAAFQGAQKFFAENSGFQKEARQTVCSSTTGRALPVNVVEGTGRPSTSSLGLAQAFEQKHKGGDHERSEFRRIRGGS